MILWPRLVLICSGFGRLKKSRGTMWRPFLLLYQSVLVKKMPKSYIGA